MGDDVNGPSDTSSGDDDPRPARVWHHVMNDIGLLPSDEGLDLNGDGSPDNALGLLSNLLPSGNAGGFLAQAEEQLILQTWWNRGAEAQAAVAVVRGSDRDGGLADGWEGLTFVVEGQLLPNGRAEVSAVVSPDEAGRYEADLPASPIDLGFIQLPTALPWRVEAQSSEDRHEGVLGTGVAVTELQRILAANQLGFLNGQVAQLADLDLDDDGTPDAISLAVSFSAVPCEVERADD